jgi:hypothetical protein
MNSIGKLILIIGLAIAFIGVLIILFDRLGIHLGKLPGDIIYRKGNTTLYFPVATSILLSILLSLILWFLRK